MYDNTKIAVIQGNKVSGRAARLRNKLILMTRNTGQYMDFLQNMKNRSTDRLPNEMNYERNISIEPRQFR